MKVVGILLIWLAIYASPTAAFLTPQIHEAQGTALFAKKAAAKKIQVKMLKNVPGTGQKGDVVQVTPAFFNNKLRPSGSASVISDDEVAGEQTEKEAALAAEKKEANEVKQALEATEIKMLKKAGPDGHLFGGIGAKVIMEEIQKQIPGHDEFLNRKGVKLVTVIDGDGKKLRQDIKETGNFGAKIALTKDICGQIKISVGPEL